MNVQCFKTHDARPESGSSVSSFHLIDVRGNHFINGKCVNPLKDSGQEIGDTHPDQSERFDEGSILKYGRCKS